MRGSEPDTKTLHTNEQYEVGDLTRDRRYRVIAREETADTERFVYRLERVGRAA